MIATLLVLFVMVPHVVGVVAAPIVACEIAASNGGSCEAASYEPFGMDAE